MRDYKSFYTRIQMQLEHWLSGDIHDIYTTFMAPIALDFEYKISRYFLEEFHMMRKEEKDFTM